MPRPSPHPLALFSLIAVPGNKPAEDAISHPENNYLTSRLSDGTLALDVGPYIQRNISETLATLGRGTGADIFVEGSSIARIQCSFEIDLETSVVMFCDRSFANSTQVFGKNTIPFEHNRIRRVLVQKDLNEEIGMGGDKCNRVQFTLVWHQNLRQIAAAIKEDKAMHSYRIENPRLARTVDEAPTEFPSQRETMSAQQQRLIRYVKGRELGSGEFGTVHEAIDVDSGRIMAVKTILPMPNRDVKEYFGRVYEREVEILSTLSHVSKPSFTSYIQETDILFQPHIVKFIASQGWHGEEVEIFLGLKEGTLQSLVRNKADAFAVAKLVFPQMLQALDYIAYKGIVHRDVKPENILYGLQPDGQYQFQLGDFGLCNHVANAKSQAGTDLSGPLRRLHGIRHTN